MYCFYIISFKPGQAEALAEKDHALAAQAAEIVYLRSKLKALEL